jgi:hypothetical protein
MRSSVGALRRARDGSEALQCLAPLVDLVGKARKIETNSDQSFSVETPAELFRRFSLTAFVHGEQLRDSHEFESFC